MYDETEVITKDIQDQFIEDLNLAKLAMLNKSNFAFIGSLIYKISIKPNVSVRTLALDPMNNSMLINPNWFNQLEAEHKASALAHEVFHYALQHDIRMGSKDPKLYQKACDEVVNNLLMDSKFQLPNDIPVDRRYQNKSSEEVYKMVVAEHKQNQTKPDNNNPLGDDLPKNQNNPNSKSNSDQNNNQLSQSQINDRNRAINQADTTNQLLSGKSIGSSSKAFGELFMDINEGKLNWLTILAEYFNELTQGELSPIAYERRYLPLGYYLPKRESDNKINKVALALDVSGSISTNQIKIFLDEIKAIKNQLDPEIIDVMTFNTRVVDVFSFKRDDDITKVKLNISGGTSLEPVFEHYNRPDNRPDFLLVFSDLECYMIPKKKEPDYKTTWLCFDNKHAEVEFGKLIHINSRDLKHE